MELTQARVRELFDYRDDGSLISKISVRGRKKGRLVGSKSGGYLNVCIDAKDYRVHRVIFLWHHGWLPERVDHQDTDRLNNRIENLRPATNAENLSNRGKNSNNTSGHKGVTFEKRRRKWRATIGISNKDIHLGYFSTPEEAHAAYSKAAIELHGEFHRSS